MKSKNLLIFSIALVVLLTMASALTMAAPLNSPTTDFGDVELNGIGTATITVLSPS